MHTLDGIHRGCSKDLTRTRTPGWLGMAAAAASATISTYVTKRGFYCDDFYKSLAARISVLAHHDFTMSQGQELESTLKDFSKGFLILGACDGGREFLKTLTALVSATKVMGATHSSFWGEISLESQNLIDRLTPWYSMAPVPDCNIYAYTLDVNPTSPSTFTCEGKFVFMVQGIGSLGSLSILTLVNSSGSPTGYELVIPANHVSVSSTFSCVHHPMYLAAFGLPSDFLPLAQGQQGCWAVVKSERRQALREITEPEALREIALSIQDLLLAEIDFHRSFLGSLENVRDLFYVVNNQVRIQPMATVPQNIEGDITARHTRLQELFQETWSNDFYGLVYSPEFVLAAQYEVKRIQNMIRLVRIELITSETKVADVMALFPLLKEDLPATLTDIASLRLFLWLKAAAGDPKERSSWQPLVEEGAAAWARSSGAEHCSNEENLRRMLYALVFTWFYADDYTKNFSRFNTILKETLENLLGHIIDVNPPNKGLITRWFETFKAGILAEAIHTAPTCVSFKDEFLLAQFFLSPSQVDSLIQTNIERQNLEREEVQQQDVLSRSTRGE